MDRESYKVLSALSLSHVRLLALEDFEKGDDELLRAKENRTRIEYYFTCTPSLPLFILKNSSEVDMITYLDADLFFFADPAALYHEIAGRSIAIIGHRFPPNLVENEKYGIYNVGWLSFRRDDSAFSCLHWWRERCLDWCYDRVEDERFADQKYLDDWPSRFPNVVVLCHKGANVAAWNLGVYNVQKQGDRVLMDEQPLIFFHYQGFRQIRSWLYDPNLAGYKVKPTRVALQGIYAPYIAALRKTTAQVLPLLETVPSPNGMRDQEVRSPSPQHVAKPPVLARFLRLMLRVTRFIMFQSYIFRLNGYIK